MRFGSLFSGVGGFDLGFERAGMKCEWQVEFDKNCQNILRKHWSETELFDDVRTVGKHNLKPVDVICGGFPCQDVSIAGKRAGLAGERSGLWHEFARIIDELEPSWVVIENVPGLLSSNRGRDFATVIRWLAQRGYGVAWRILDSQHFGVAQRRRRVFIVGSFGNGSAAEILFESNGVRWDTEKGRKTGKGTAGTFTIRTGSEGGGKGYLGLDDGAMALGGQPQWVNQVTTHRMTAFGEYSDDGKAGAVKARDYKDATDLIAYDIHQNDDRRKDRPNGGLYVNKTDTSLTLSTGQGKSKTIVLNDQGGSQMSVTENVSAKLRSQEHGHQPIVMAYENHPNDSRITETGDISQQLTSRMGTGGGNVPLVQVIGHSGGETLKFNEKVNTLNAQSGSETTAMFNGVMASGVRRLTPTECERLQGFSDGWTDGQADSHRYKQMGNAVTVNVAEWIGKRINQSETQEQKCTKN